MNNPFFKSIVNSIQTATVNYFSPKPQRQYSIAQQSSPGTSTVDPLSSPSRPPTVGREMAPHDVVAKRLFKDVVFYDSSGLNESHRDILLNGGASELEEIVGEGVPWDEITHVFTADFDFPGKEDAMKNPTIAIVTPRWIEVSAMRTVLQNPKNFSPDPNMIFSGLVVTCAELPAGDREAIFGGFAAYGGMYDDVLRTTTTHVIALNTDNEKCRKAMKEPKLGIKVVLPHWFDDCLKLRRKVDEKPYLLPDPPLFKALAAQNIGINAAEPVSSDHLAYTHFGSVKSQSSPPQSTAIIFKGNHTTVFLAKDLGVTARLRDTLEQVIQHAGGKLVDSVDKAQVYVGMWREKDDYVQASRKGAVVGNLTWLYYMLANDRWISPRCHLLHYPCVRGGMAEMQSMIMTVTNYQGEARAYLEKLIEACGAKFTRNMTTQNTHLIAASKAGDKCKHAHDWGIDIVNHLWLEETYAKWQLQSVTVPRYTHFPPQTNLTEIIDKTEIQEEGIREFYMQREEDEEEMQDVQQLGSSTATNGNVQSSYMQHSEQKTPAPVARKVSATSKGPVTPAAGPTETPGSTRRKAAENAMNKLHNEIMPDVLAWQKEKNRKRIPEEPLEVDEKKRKVERQRSEEKENLVEGVSKKSKKDSDVTKDASETNKIVLLVTGASHDFLNATSIKKLLKLGVKVVTEGGYCTHLAAPSILRTEKFLCALPYGPTVVSLDWVEQCLEQDAVVDVQGYLLRDPESEKKYRTKLTETVAKARKNQRKLFKNYQIYISSSVIGHAALVRIVEMNGGEAKIVPNTIKPRAKVLRSDYVREVDQVLISSDNDDDNSLRTKFCEEVVAIGLQSQMYTSEWIMRSVLRQEIAKDSEFVVT